MIQSLDISTFENIASVDLVVKHPVTGADTAATITLAGPEHPTRKSLVYARARAMRQEYQRTGKVEATDPEDDARVEKEFISKCVLGWNGISSNGVPLPFSPERALTLLSDPRRAWMYAQVKVALDSADLFIKDSSKA